MCGLRQQVGCFFISPDGFGSFPAILFLFYYEPLMLISQNKSPKIQPGEYNIALVEQIQVDTATFSSPLND